MGCQRTLRRAHQHEARICVIFRLRRGAFAPPLPPHARVHAHAPDTRVLTPARSHTFVAQKWVRESGAWVLKSSEDIDTEKHRVAARSKQLLALAQVAVMLSDR